jgi:hypothetical protein
MELIPNDNLNRPSKTATITVTKVEQGYEVVKTEFKRAGRTSLAYLINGVFYWKVGEEFRPIDLDICRDYALEQLPEFNRELQQQVVSNNAKNFFQNLRAANVGRVLSAEERFEARAAFGPNAKYIDLRTGQTHRTGK